MQKYINGIKNLEKRKRRNKTNFKIFYITEEETLAIIGDKKIKILKNN